MHAARASILAKVPVTRKATIALSEVRMESSAAVKSAQDDKGPVVIVASAAKFATTANGVSSSSAASLTLPSARAR